MLPKLTELISHGVEQTLQTPNDIDALYADVIAFSYMQFQDNGPELPQFIWRLNLFGDLWKRLADDPTFEEQLERAKVARYLYKSCIYYWIRDFDYTENKHEFLSIYEQIIESLIQWIFNGFKFLEEGKYQLLSGVSRAVRKLFRFDNGAILLNLAALNVPSGK